MHHLIAAHFILLAETQKSGTDWTFQAESYATLAMFALRFHFERNLPVSGEKLLAMWEEMLAVAKS